MTAEPLFAPRGARAGSRRDAGNVVVGPARSSRAAHRGAGEGDLVLVAEPRRGSQAKVLRKIGRPEVAGHAIEALMPHGVLRRAFGAAGEDAAPAATARLAAPTADP